MNLNKYTPAGLRFMQLIINFKQRAQSSKVLHSFNKRKLEIHMFTTLAFLWPLSLKKTSSRKETLKLEPEQFALKNADDMFENGHYELCHQLLSSMEQNDDVEVQWRICRVLYNISKESKDEAYKKDLIMRAYDMISKQLETHSDNFAVQKWYALMLDAKSTYGGIKERIKQLETVKKHMDLAVTLNPADATTLHMLGEWCYQVAELPWHQRKIAETFFASPPHSNYEDALEYFLRAESVQPRFYSMNLLRLGNCYLKLHKDDQAKYYLNLAASYPAKSNDDHKANKEAAELLKKMK